MSSEIEAEIANCFVERKMQLPAIIKYLKEKHGVEPSLKMILSALSAELQQNIISNSAVLNMAPAQMQPYIASVLHLPVTIAEIEKVVAEFHANIIYQGVHRGLGTADLQSHFQDVFHVLVPEAYFLQVLETHQREYEMGEEEDDISQDESNPSSVKDIWMEEAERVVPLKVRRLTQHPSQT